MQDVNRHDQARSETIEVPLLGRLDELEARARAFDEQARRFVRKNPTLALAGAVAVGFVIGKVFK